MKPKEAAQATDWAIRTQRFMDTNQNETIVNEYWCTHGRYMRTINGLLADSNVLPDLSYPTDWKSCEQEVGDRLARRLVGPSHRSGRLADILKPDEEACVRWRDDNGEIYTLYWDGTSLNEQINVDTWTLFSNFEVIDTR